MKPAKPLYRQPCNGCGFCCLSEQCSLSVMVFGEQPRCPAIVDAGERFACGLIAEPDRYYEPGHEAEGALYAGTLLGIGTYCDSIESDADRITAWALGELGA